MLKRLARIATWASSAPPSETKEGAVFIDLDPDVQPEPLASARAIERDRVIAAMPPLPAIPDGAWVHMASNRPWPGFPGGDDYAAAWALTDGGIAAVVADGASGGDEGFAASRFLVDFVVRHVRAMCSPADLALILLQADEAVRKLRLHSDTTAVLVTKRVSEVALSAQGDSHAFALTQHGFDCLTDRQLRKPRIGSGLETLPFSRSYAASGMIVLGSDGVFPPYDSAASRIAAVRANPLDPARAVERDVLTGRTGYPDDLSVVVIA